MHADQAHRDSLSADLMEPIRPLVDAYAIRLLTSRPFAARDFFETSVGACRITAPLTHELAETSRHWGRLVGRVAEDLAAALEVPGTRPSGTPTPISGRKRAEGRPTSPALTRNASPAKRRACSWCGSPARAGHQTCGSECADRVLGQTHEQFAARSSERMRQFAGRSDHPGLTPEANRKRSPDGDVHLSAQLDDGLDSYSRATRALARRTAELGPAVGVVTFAYPLSWNEFLAFEALGATVQEVEFVTEPDADDLRVTYVMTRPGADPGWVEAEAAEANVDVLGIVSANVTVPNSATLACLEASGYVYLVDLSIADFRRLNPGAIDVLQNDVFWSRAGWL